MLILFIFKFLKNLSRTQKSGSMISTFCAMVLLGLHNPFGDYEYYSRGVNDRWIEINSPLEYTSMNTLFDWIRTPSEVIGFLIPVIIFGVV